MTRQEQETLLGLITTMGSYGRAEAEPEAGFLTRFLPLPEHARCLHPDIVLVIGDRGAGKTELFRAIQTPGGCRLIGEIDARNDIPDLGHADWLVGFSSSGREFPPEMVFRNFAAGKQPSDLQVLWLGLLVRSLLSGGVLSGVSGDAGRVVATVGDPSLKLVDLAQAVSEHMEGIFSVLDGLDKDLSVNDRWVFVTYDELDRVSAGDWDAMRTILRGLVQFWASYVRRWRRLRPKLFVRRDLYTRVALFGPDVSKIAAQRVELTWTARNLYALTVKRLVNHDSRMRDYLGRTLPEGEERGELGWLPTARKEADYRPFLERMCGQFMGAGPNKGQSFTWIPNHLQDGNGQVLPRSFVRLFECAAEMERANPQAEPPRLFHHSSLREAVDQVSVSRMQELEDEEFPWLKHVKAAVAEAHPQVPMERQELERLITLDWDNKSEKAPDTSGRDLLRLLIELGLFYLRADGRVDARDLYMKGFGLKRKGGVKRPY
jgi:hypothetical protein